MEVKSRVSACQEPSAMWKFTKVYARAVLLKPACAFTSPEDLVKSLDSDLVERGRPEILYFC